MGLNLVKPRNKLRRNFPQRWRVWPPEDSQETLDQSGAGFSLREGREVRVQEDNSEGGGGFKREGHEGGVVRGGEGVGRRGGGGGGGEEGRGGGGGWG